MANELDPGEQSQGEPSPEAKLWQLYANTPDQNMVTALLEGGESDTELQAVTKANFELGGYFYQKLKGRGDLDRPIYVALAQSGDYEQEKQKIERFGNFPVRRVRSNFDYYDDYLAHVRGYRILAEHELWDLNIRRIRLSSKDRSQTADQDVETARKLHRRLNSAAAQLNGAAQASLEEGDLQGCLLLCEAAGDFLPEGQTVIRINDNLSHKNETLEKVLEFMNKKGSDELMQEVFKGTMSAIQRRIQDKQRSVAGFEKHTLPALGKPGDVMYHP